MGEQGNDTRPPATAAPSSGTPIGGTGGTGPGWRLWAALGVAALVAVAVLAFTVGHSCGRTGPVVEPPTGIDAGPAETAIAARLDAGLQAEEAAIRAVEQKHQDDLDAMDARQRAEYDAVRRQGRTAVAAWLTDFNRGLRDGGPP